MRSFEDFLREEQSNRVFGGMSPMISDDLYLELKAEYENMIKRQMNSEPLLVLCEKVLKDANNTL